MSDWYNRSQKYRDDHKEMTRQYRKRNRVSSWISSVKGRAKHLGLDYNLTEEDYLIPELCPILNIPLFFTYKKRTDNTPSVDRHNPEEGYIKGNCSIISWRANRLKCNASLSELKALVEYMETR